jgi:hypothetical protein
MNLANSTAGATDYEYVNIQPNLDCYGYNYNVMSVVGMVLSLRICWSWYTVVGSVKDRFKSAIVLAVLNAT